MSERPSAMFGSPADDVLVVFACPKSVGCPSIQFPVVCIHSHGQRVKAMHENVHDDRPYTRPAETQASRMVIMQLVAFTP